jgi:membrane protease YdiL (CAAX protease family)
MEDKKELTKDLLTLSFRELILKIPFDKITIKMITDGAGVILFISIFRINTGFLNIFSKKRSGKKSTYSLKITWKMIFFCFSVPVFLKTGHFIKSCT